MLELLPLLAEGGWEGIRLAKASREVDGPHPNPPLLAGEGVSLASLLMDVNRTAQ
jgi:hypothetical protein